MYLFKSSQSNKGVKSPSIHSDLLIKVCEFLPRPYPPSEKALQGGECDDASGGMAMVDASLVLDAIVAVSIAAGALFAVLELRDLKRERRLGLLLQACMHCTTREFEDALSKAWRADASDAKGLEKQVSAADLYLISDFLVSIAHLGQEGLVDTRTLTGFFPFSYLWYKMKPWIVAERAAAGLPKIYYEWE